MNSTGNSKHKYRNILFLTHRRRLCEKRQSYMMFLAYRQCQLCEKFMLMLAVFTVEEEEEMPQHFEMAEQEFVFRDFFVK